MRIDAPPDGVSNPPAAPPAPSSSAAAEPAPIEHEPVGAEAPDIAQLETAIERRSIRSMELTILTGLAVLYTLYFAREFALPVVFAILLTLFLRPAVRALERAHIPAPAGAAVIVVALVGVLGGGVYAVSGPAQDWLARAPKTIALANRKLRKLRAPVEQVTRTAEQVESATSVSGGVGAAREVIVRGPSLVSRVFGTTTSFVAGLLEVIVLLYFLLAGSERFLQKLVRVLPRLRDRQAAVRIARETESSISTYLFTIAVVNITEGLVVAGLLLLIGMPNPLLWGVLVMLLEFIPYLGAAAMTIILALAGLTTFDAVGHALLAPALFLGVSLLQANLVSPVLLGHRLTLNPVAIFVALALWYFLWGIPGAFIAVPLLAALKILCDNLDVLRPIGEFLGR